VTGEVAVPPSRGAGVRRDRPDQVVKQVIGAKFRSTLLREFSDFT
jgi:hypothetical protein